MTAPRQQTDATDPNIFATGQQVDPSGQEQFNPPAAQSVPIDTPVPTQEPSRPADNAATGDALFADHDLTELRARWNDVQAAFVDDPRACVQKADSLVSSAVEQLTANFSRTRSQLEDQWSRGEEASTEDLRVALKRYRDFFDRLLAV
jgi:hypothetical protein